MKHGLRARTIILPGEDEGAFNARLDAWTDDLGPRDEVERFLVARAVEVSWKLDRVGRVLEARRVAARHADADRLAAQAEEVVALGCRLFWDPVGPLCLYPHAATVGGEPRRVSYSGNPDDPDDPARLVVRLEAMALGCAWLLDRWGELRDILGDGRLWQPHDRLKAVRLLGRQPLEAPDDPRVMAIYLHGWAMDRKDPDAFTDMANELGPGELGVFEERLMSRGMMGGMPPRPEAARAEMLALIADEEERLEAALAGHLEREEAELQAELAFDAGASGERLRRYEASNDRTLLRLVEALRKRHREADGGTPSGRRAAVRANSGSGGRASLPVEAPPREPSDFPTGRAEEAAPEPVDLPGWRDATHVDIECLPADRADAGHEAHGEVPDRGFAGPIEVADVDIEVPPSIDPGSRNPTEKSGRPATPTPSLAGAVLALFALLFLAGILATSARSSIEPPAAKPDRLVGRILARSSSEAPIPARWLCSSPGFRSPSRCRAATAKHSDTVPLQIVAVRGGPDRWDGPPGPFRVGQAVQPDSARSDRTGPASGWTA